MGGGRGLERDGKMNAGEEINTGRKRWKGVEVHLGTHEGYERSSAYWL